MGLVLTDLLDAPKRLTPLPVRSSGSEQFRRGSLPPVRCSPSRLRRTAIFVRLRSLQLPRRGRDRAMSFAGWGLRSHEVVTPHPASIYPLSHVRVLGPKPAAVHDVAAARSHVAPNNGARGNP